MGWGPDPVWSEGTVESNFQACPSGSCVSLKIAVGDGTTFVNPGQYVQVKVVGGAFCAHRRRQYYPLIVATLPKYIDER